jgi:hypothetical protein
MCVQSLANRWYMKMHVFHGTMPGLVKTADECGDRVKAIREAVVLHSGGASDLLLDSASRSLGTTNHFSTHHRPPLRLTISKLVFALNVALSGLQTLRTGSGRDYFRHRQTSNFDIRTVRWTVVCGKFVKKVSRIRSRSQKCILHI